MQWTIAHEKERWEEEDISYWQKFLKQKDYI